MSIPSNLDTKEDRKRLKTLKPLKSARLILALILTLASSISCPSADSAIDNHARTTLQSKFYLTTLFLTGYYVKEQLAHMVKIASDVVWPVSKQKSFEESFADRERPVVIKTVNAALQIALKMFIQESLKKAGASEIAAKQLATAFDAGIKISSLLKLIEVGVTPVLAQFKDLLLPFITINPSDYRYALNQPLDVVQGTSSCCGLQDPHCLSIPRENPVMLQNAPLVSLEDEALRLSGSLVLTVLGYKLADMAYDVGQILSPHVPRLLLMNALGEDAVAGELEKYLQKVTQRFVETQFGDTFVRMLVGIIQEGNAELDKAYDALPEDKKNSPEARAQVAKKVEKTIVNDIVKGILGVIGYKVSWPTEQAFINALIA